MVRWLLLALLLVVLAGAVGFLALGAFPPDLHPSTVHKLVPNDHIGRSN